MKWFCAQKGKRQVRFRASTLPHAMDYFNRVSFGWGEAACYYDIAQISTLPEPILDFLKAAGRGPKKTKTNTSIMSKTKAPDEVSNYMAAIGSKGGKSNPAGTIKRREQARAAAAKRWAKYREEKKKKAESK